MSERPIFYKGKPVDAMSREELLTAVKALIRSWGDSTPVPVVESNNLEAGKPGC